MVYVKRFRFLLHVSLLTSTLLFIFGLTHVSIAFAAPTPTLYCPPGQSNGGSGNSTEWVQAIQFRLNNLRRWDDDDKLTHLWADPDMPLATDGVFGNKTQTAVSDFQTDWNITGGGGAVGDRTWDAMGFCNNTTPHVPSEGAYSSLQSPYTCPTVTLSQGGSNDPL